MAIHDWSRVDAGIFHDFHGAWVTSLRTTLNEGLLPEGYYALGEQVAGDTGPDVLTHHVTPSNGAPAGFGFPQGATAVETAPPRVRFVARNEIAEYTLKQRTLVIRHISDNRVVALIEIMSPGNKASSVEFDRFLDKALSALKQGIHLLIIDLFAPTSRDSEGIHGAIWARLGTADFQLPADKPLTLVAYTAGPTKVAYVEPVAVGDYLIDMPVFLSPDAYVSAPLEKTYQEAYRGVPHYWRDVLEGKS